MTRTQKKVAAWIAIGVLCLAVIAMLWLSILTAQSRFTVDPGHSSPQLLTVWEFLLWFMKKGAALNATFAVLLALIAAAVTALSEVYKKQRQLVAITVLCVVGILCCIYMMVKLDAPANLATLRYFTGFADDAQASAAVVWTFGSLLGWFAAFLAVQLGLRSLAQGAGRRDKEGGGAA